MLPTSSSCQGLEIPPTRNCSALCWLEPPPAEAIRQQYHRLLPTPRSSVHKKKRDGASPQWGSCRERYEILDLPLKSRLLPPSLPGPPAAILGPGAPPSAARPAAVPHSCHHCTPVRPAHKGWARCPPTPARAELPILGSDHPGDQSSLSGASGGPIHGAVGFSYTNQSTDRVGGDLLHLVGTSTRAPAVQESHGRKLVGGQANEHGLETAGYE